MVCFFKCIRIHPTVAHNLILIETTTYFDYLIQIKYLKWIKTVSYSILLYIVYSKQCNRRCYSILITMKNLKGSEYDRNIIIDCELIGLVEGASILTDARHDRLN